MAHNDNDDDEGSKIDESVEDTVILLSQFRCVGFRISNQFRIFRISALKAAVLITFNFQYMIVCGTVQPWFVGTFKSATTEKWSKIISDVDKERTSHPLDKIHNIKRMTVKVGRKINTLMEIERLQNTSELSNSR